ncbi:murein transglycosylase A [Elioraea tepida]|uniref:peptidoglycan lytic exotransglycosylase n=1 Tax=Elioraea tepida TaxID=2843330 RepID=A0A975U4H7_9PROT|nr:murein transglycosylase A [Elioraea tepida]
MGRSAAPFRGAGRALRGAVVSAALLLAGCIAVPVPTPPAPPDKLGLVPWTFERLPGWAEERHAELLPAFAESCRRFAALPPDRPLGGAEPAQALAGRVADWLPLCAEAATLPPGDDAAVRAFLERRFRPWLAQNVGGAQPDPFGLFTGYYEPEVSGSRSRRPGSVPLHTRPPDLVLVDLGEFAEDLRGRRTAGRVEQGRLVPYATRAEIVRGALDGRRLELLWVDDPVDAFFLQVQGSGRVNLAEGGVARVGFAAQNGHPYVPIGRVLVERGVMRAEEVSMQAIRAWLAANPGEAAAVMDANPSYVFFREIRGLAPNEGPPGAFGVPLTPERSIAVDRSFIPLGIPVFIDVPHPLTGQPWRRALMAQDVGGAVRGPVRGDVFWGWGEAAGEAAGRMRGRGAWWLLLPATVGR